MAQNTLLRATGLYTFPSHLGAVPQGALLRAKNVVINRDAIIELRRGFKIFGNAIGAITTDTAHQLLSYKSRLLRHWGSGAGTTLEFDSDGNGVFSGFVIALTANTHTSTTVDGFVSTSELYIGMKVTGSGVPVGTTIKSIENNTSLTLSVATTTSLTGTALSFSQTIAEIDLGLRIKGIESNGNFYFTTASGIKKISVATAATLPTSQITNAGGIKALDTTLTLNPEPGWFTQESAVAYRLVWGITDPNNNLILGAPSERAVIYNSLTPLLASNFNQLLVNLDTLNNTGGIHSQNYVSTLKVSTNASAASIKSSLEALTTALDADTAITSAAATATASISNYIGTLVFGSSVASFLSPGDIITINSLSAPYAALNGTFTISTVATTTITFPVKAIDVASAGALGGVVHRNKYTLNPFREIPAAVSSPQSINGIEIKSQVAYIQFSGDVSSVFKAKDIVNIVGLANTLSPLNGDRTVLGLQTITNTNDTLQISINSPNTATTGIITANTVANPTVVTITAHGLLSNDIITITGSNSTPVIDGVWKISSPTTNTFTVPVNVSVAGTSGFAYSADKSIDDINGTVTLNQSDLDLTLSVSPTSGQLVALQAYYDNIVASLQAEPSGIATAASTVFASDGSTQSATVNVKFTIPRNITTAYFYQIYRTSVATSVDTNTLSNIDPGDEEQLVYEANPTNADLTAGFIQIQDVTIDSFRGANLYTNPNSGDGILQANDVPPLAKDLTSFKGYTFYSNTQTKFRKNVDLLSVTEFVSGTSTLTITDGVTSNTYTFVLGVANVSTVTTVADVANSLNNKYFTLSSANNETNYYVWYSTGTGIDPALPGKTGIKVTLTTGDGANTVASKTKAMLNTYSDFSVGVSTNVVTITNTNKGIATATANGAASTGFTFNTTVVGKGEDAANKKVLISSLPTPAQEVDETARSLERVINQNASELVYAFYTSGPSDVPGLMLFESRNLGGNAFYFNVNDAATTGSQFDPALPISGSSVISSNETNPNRIYFSKFQQPEAVPIVNFLDVGARDKAILRILALRDSLFILKEEGIFRISGSVSPFNVALFDSSTNLKAPDSAVVLNNLIYSFTTQGIATVSDTGVQIISRPIEDQLIKLTSSQYTNFSTATFAVSYESDRSYNLFTVTNTSDVYATQGFKFNTFTNSWTSPDFAKRSGIVNPGEDKMYLSATDVNHLEQERKNFDRTDYADRELVETIDAGNYSGTSLVLSSVSNITAGDVLVQVQSLSMLQFNSFLTKLDNDGGLVNNDYVSSLTVESGVNLRDALTALATHLDTDTGITSPAFAAAISGYGTTFQDQQDAFNVIITLLNASEGPIYKNYRLSANTVQQEVVITAVNTNFNTLTLAHSYPLIQGPITIYNHIPSDVIWVPQFMQDVSLSKQVMEGTVIFENSSFTSATISYSSDISTGFEDLTFTGDGNGSYGYSTYGETPYGGSGNGVPFRAYIPKEKQRCRYLNCRFQHATGRELYSLYGLSLSYNITGTRAWR